MGVLKFILDVIAGIFALLVGLIGCIGCGLGCLVVVLLVVGLPLLLIFVFIA